MSSLASVVRFTAPCPGCDQPVQWTQRPHGTGNASPEIDCDCTTEETP